VIAKQASNLLRIILAAMDRRLHPPPAFFTAFLPFASVPRTSSPKRYGIFCDAELREEPRQRSSKRSSCGSSWDKINA